MFNYKSIYEVGSTSGIGGERHMFRSVARDGFNALDSPDDRFFKLLFYFQDKDEIGNDEVMWSVKNGGGTSEMTSFDNTGSGLLVRDWDEGVVEYPNLKPFYTHNSAYSYLMNNLEVERAEELKQFITLLSNISSNSPWYFKEISGVDEALGRENFKVDEERKKITITCMEDPIDHRISTLLSAYRSIVWSHARKCEVLPANLRKFDMGLFVFSSLTMGPHVAPGIPPVANEKGLKLSMPAFNDESWKDVDVVENTVEGRPRSTQVSEELDIPEYDQAIVVEEKATFTASCKFIEFHNCEISMDSIKSGFSTLSNESGVKQEFKIDIYFDDCYEMEYNQFLMESFGDLLLSDVGLNVSYDEDPDKDSVLDSNKNVNSTSFFGGIGNVDLLQKTLMNSIYPFENNNSNPTPTEQNSVAQKKLSWKQKAKKDFANLTTNVFGPTISNVKQTAVNSVMKAANVVGLGLGNMYDKGVIGNALDTIRKQANSLANKAIGNVSKNIEKAISNAQKTAETAVNGVVKIGNTYAETAVDAIDDTAGAVTKALNNITESAIDNIVQPAVNKVVDKATGHTTKLGDLTRNVRGKVEDWEEGVEEKIEKNADQRDLGSMLDEDWDEDERVLAYGSSVELGNMNNSKKLISNL